MVGDSAFWSSKQYLAFFCSSEESMINSHDDQLTNLLVFMYSGPAFFSLCRSNQERREELAFEQCGGPGIEGSKAEKDGTDRTKVLVEPLY